MFYFGKRSFLDPDVEAWHLEIWRWFLRQPGEHERPKSGQLILPEVQFFPPSESVGHERALYLFQCVKNLIGMEGLEVDLIPQDRLALNVGTFLSMENPQNPAGTFQSSGNCFEITYDPALLDRPQALVSTFAHELAHLLHATIAEQPPGGDATLEPATDVTVSMLGFGIFGANSAFQYEQFSDFERQGFRTQKLGYLSEEQWLFDLALYCSLAGQLGDVVLAHLKPSLHKRFKKARSYTEKNLEAWNLA